MEKKDWNYKKKAAVIAIGINVIMSIIELLVLLRVLPYDVIGGGRLGSYEKAAGLAVFSILMQLLIGYCIAVASHILLHGKMQKLSRAVLKFFTVYFSINIVMNLMGKTWFERIVGSIMCVIQITCFIIIVSKKEKVL